VTITTSHFKSRVHLKFRHPNSALLNSAIPSFHPPEIPVTMSSAAATKDTVTAQSAGNAEASNNNATGHAATPVDPRRHIPYHEYPAFKAWKDAGGLEEFANNWHVKVEDVADGGSNLSEQVAMAYFDIVHRIPGMREQMQEHRSAWEEAYSVDTSEHYPRIARDGGNYGWTSDEDESSEDEEVENEQARSVSQETRGTPDTTRTYGS
jgi:hypothetical protein